MFVYRKGATRNVGTTTIIGADTITWTGQKYDAPKWDKKNASIEFRTKGEDRGSNYTYTVSLSSAEILRFLELAVDANSNDALTRGAGMAAIAMLREITKPAVDSGD